MRSQAVPAEQGPDPDAAIHQLSTYWRFRFFLTRRHVLGYVQIDRLSVQMSTAAVIVAFCPHALHFSRRAHSWPQSF